MSTYICKKCGCIDNTACGGNYWLVHGKKKYFDDEYANNNELCVECTPEKFDDGSKTGGGKWHNKFAKEHWSKRGTVEEIITICKKNQGNYVNAIEYFKENNLYQGD